MKVTKRDLKNHQTSPDIVVHLQKGWTRQPNLVDMRLYDYGKLF